MTLICEKLDQAVAILNELDLDCWMTFVRETGEGGNPVLPLILGQTLTWQSALIVSRGGERTAIVGNFEEDAVKSLGAWTRVVPYVQGIREVLRETLSRLNPRQIGVNYSLSDVKADGLSHGMYRVLLEHLEGTPWSGRLVSAERVIGALRGRKTPSELERIRRAVRVAEQIFDEAFAFARVGVTERQIASFMQERARERGVGLAWDASACPIVNTGPNSMVGHGLPGDIAIEPGHLLHIDFGVVVDGYCSDLQRMVYVPRPGESRPPDDVAKAFDAVATAIRRSAERIKPGAIGWEVDALARRVLTDAGFPEYQHGLGHNVGRAAHDGGALLGPRWERYGQSPMMPVEQGNVFTIEPSILSAAGLGCLGLEEMVVVTESGCEYLSRPQRELRMLK